MTRYRTQGPIGIGRHGPVVRATPEWLGSAPVALRDLSIPAGPRRTQLRVDAERLALLGHPGLGRVEDITVVDDATVRVATTLGPDGSLADRLTRGPLAAAAAIEVVDAVADALAAAHAIGLSHRALSAHEIVIGDNTVLVCDVALANALDRPSAAASGAVVDIEDLATLAPQWIDPAERTTAATRLRQACAGVAADPTLGWPALRAALHPTPVMDLVDELGVTRPLPPSPAPGRRPRDRVLVGVGAGLLGLAVGAVAGFSPTPDANATPRAVAAPPSTARPTTVARCDAGAVPEPLRPAVGHADVNGDGCADAIHWEPDTAVLSWVDAGRVHRLQVGEPDDQLLLGDWDCNATTTVGLYRPRTGETFQFSTWASDGTQIDAAAGPPLSINADVHAAPVDDGCDQIVAR